MTTDGRPRILVLNQYYWPGVEATAQLSRACEALAADYDVTVVTGHLHGHDLPSEEERNGVRIVRVRSTRTSARSSTCEPPTTRATSATRSEPRSAASGPTSSSA